MWCYDNKKEDIVDKDLLVLKSYQINQYVPERFPDLYFLPLHVVL